MGCARSAPRPPATIGTTLPPKAGTQPASTPGLPRDQNGRVDVLQILPQKDPQLPSLLLSGKIPPGGQEAFADKPIEVKGNRDVSGLGPSTGFACKKGRKESAPKAPNQDTFLILQSGFTRIYGVFDGHGPYGHAISSFAAQSLVTHLAVHLSLQEDPPVALHDSFQAVQRECIQKEKSKRSVLDCRLSGTTATLLLDRRLPTGSRELCVAHCGDSRAVLAYRAEEGSAALTAMDLTMDHKPGLEEERARIVAAGGVVRRHQGDPNDRIFLPNMLCPGLAMSRSLGDTMAHSVGASCEPEVSVHAVRPGWRFVLVCSDGVWEFITSQEAVDFVARFPPEEAHRAAQELAEEARTRWQREEDGTFDDITALCVWLD